MQQLRNELNNFKTLAETDFDDLQLYINKISTIENNS